jgi:hypothetical protein
MVGPMIVRLGPADPNRVDIDRPAERQWWCRHFEATTDDLCSAVRAVGTEPLAVCRELVRRIERRPKATASRRGRRRTQPGGSQ